MDDEIKSDSESVANTLDTLAEVPEKIPTEAEKPIEEASQTEEIKTEDP
jgi:hypothetical protein